MNFFRLRVINTLLLFFIGVVLGFILKEKFYPAAPAPRAEYKQAYAAPEAPAPKPEAEEELVDEPYAPAEEEPRRAETEKPAPPQVIAPDPREQAVIETPAEKPARNALVKGEESDFFASPLKYEGRDLEMELQMITARKAQGRWRLNLVYSGGGRKVDYLYVDDDGVLGEKPDLRIGYVYRIRFSCARGLSDAGNTLISILPTGGKADWATGLSAVE